ncbi:hypothetical protein [Natronosalvus rutilus]|uniref:DUF2069 domain-containing protein n=1 Tax=Natronosalvus rutilus TaxID=2953753 RepID=A0A9E7NAJ6_9EURY|nr:hypothetical protein [Natronosalvus rutilus]UTF53494.1 hypothetical protein NGM29_17260 [Natronosalvus rutilus]
MTTPLGVLAIAAFTGLYGLVWLVYWLASLGQPTVLTGVAPLIALGAFALAVGLCQRRTTAWALTLALYGFGLLWTTAQLLGGANRFVALLVAVLILGYLVGRRDLFLESASSEVDA